MQVKIRKIKVAFYKKSKSLFGGVISFQQKYLQGLEWKHSQYSHAEIVFCDLTRNEISKIKKTGFQKDKRKGIELSDLPDYFWVWFSSSETDGGVRFKNMIPSKENWDFIDIKVTEKQYSDMLEKAISLNGKKITLFLQF